MRRLRRLSRCLCLLALCAASATVAAVMPRTGSDWIQRRWTVDDGLPSNALTAVVQDDFGLIWIATLAGLVRFDGVHFDVHDAARHAALSSDRFTSMHRTPDGALWLSTEHYELLRFADGDFRRIANTEAIAVARSPSGWLAYGTTNGLLVVGPDGERLLPDALHGERVYRLDWPEDGRIIAATATAIVAVDTPMAAARVTSLHAIDGTGIRALLQGRDGRLRFVDEHGLHVIENGTARTLSTRTDVVGLDSVDREHVFINAVDEIAELVDDAWVTRGANFGSRGAEPLSLQVGDASWRMLADRIDRGEASLLSLPGRIADAIVDREGSVWIATGSAGLLQLRASPVLAIGRDEGLPGENTYPLLATHSGELLVASLDGGGLARWHPATGAWRTQPLPFAVVWSLAETRNGQIWVAGDGLCRLEADACVADGLPPDLQHAAPIRAMHEDPAGRFWVSGQWGLWRRDGEVWRLLPAASNTRLGRGARAFADGDDGVLYVATNGDGVLVFRDGLLEQRITRDQGLASDVVRSLHYDRDGLLVGTENRGLCRVLGATVRCLDKRHGLPGNSIHAIAPDTRGRLWFNSNDGVFALQRDALGACFDGRANDVGGARLFTARNGLRSTEGNGAVSPPYLRDTEGRLWFPGQRGLSIIDPRRLDPGTSVLSVRIDTARVADRTFAPQGPLALPLGERSATFGFVIDSFVDPEYAQFRWRLREQGAAWHELGTQRALTLSALPPGVWTLDVVARTAGAAWPEHGASLALDVPTYWYEREVVGLIAAMLAMTAIALLFLLRQRRLLDRQRELEAVVATRTADLRAAQQRTESALVTVREQHADLTRLHRSRTEFAANISHELKTPLTLLTSPLAEHPDIANVVGDDLYAAMRDSGQRMQRLLRQLADLDLIDSAALRLDRRTEHANAFVARCVLPFAALAAQRGQRLQSSLRADADAALDIDRFQFEKVLGNLLSNAIKFTPADGTIEISTDSDATRVHVRIEDDGAGVAAEHRRAIFERFFQVDGSRHRQHEGSGIGLALAHEIVTLHGGNLSYVDAALGGAGFEIEMPRTYDLSDDGAVVDVHSDAIGPASAEPAFASSETDDRPRVLIVEDQPTLRTYLRSALAQRYAVDEAADGAAGFARAREWLPDVIVSDVMMPLVDGLTMARHLRADATTRCIPLLFLTALDGERDQIEGLLAGGDDYIAKPFSAEVVRARIDSRMRARRDLLDTLQPAAVEPVAATPSPPDLPMRIRTIVRTHLDDEAFDVDMLVRLLATSRSQLHRRLQAEHDTSAGELISRTRLDAAAELLIARRGSVTEVCYSVGFRSLSSFTRAFKAVHGVTPGEFAGHRVAD